MSARFPIIALLLGLSACTSTEGVNRRLDALPRSGIGEAYPATPIRWHIGPGCTADPARRARSRQELADQCRDQPGRAGRDFVAIAISGGGAKAATFGGEALFMLERFGLLQQADIVSGVSGGSFAATLFALSCDPWDEPCKERIERGARPVWSYAQTMGRLTQGYWPLITEAAARLFLPILPVAIPNERFASYIDHAYLADAQGREAGFTFADLNPRRPHLFVNSSIVSGQRFILDDAEACQQVSRRGSQSMAGFLRRRAADEVSHFSFTDFYFRRLCSDITTYPLASAVAAASAFPALIDFARVTDHARRGRNGPARLLLTDGGANDNQGLIEVYMTLAEVLAGQRRSDARAAEMPGTGAEVFARTDRGLIFVVNTSLTDATGVDDEPAYSPSIFGYLFSTVRRTSAAFDRASAATYSTRSRLYLRELDLAARDFERSRGWTGWRDEGRIRVHEIGLTVLDEYAAGGPEAQLRQTRGLMQEPGAAGESRWLEQPVPGAQSLYDSDQERLQRQANHQLAAFNRLRDPQLRQRLGLTDIHPQCLFERSKQADAGLLTLASLPEGLSTCLRHAARWSVALRAQELCNDLNEGKLPLSDPQAFADACRDGELSLLPAFIDGTQPGLGRGTAPYPLAACAISAADDDMKPLLAEAEARRSRSRGDLLPDANCRIVDRAHAGR